MPGSRGSGAIPILLLTIVAVTVMVVFAAGDNVAEVFFADEALGAPGWGYGVLATAWMAGMVAGVLLIARRLEPPALAPAILAAGVVGGLAVVGASAMSTVAPAAILFVLGGAANGVENATMRNLIYHRVPERLHGRVFAAYIGLVNAMQIGATALGGFLVMGVGPRWALLVCGLGAALVGAIGLGVFAFLPERTKVAAYVTAGTSDPDTEWSAAWQPSSHVTRLPEAEDADEVDVDVDVEASEHRAAKASGA